MDVRQAVVIAKQYANELYDSKLQDVRLEEVELDDPVWRVTLSWLDPASQTPSGALAAAFGTKGMPREYKILEIYNDNGVVRSMKIRIV